MAFWDLKKLFGKSSLGIKVSMATQVKKGEHFHRPRTRRAAADGTSEPLKNMRHRNRRRSVSQIFKHLYVRKHVY